MYMCYPSAAGAARGARGGGAAGRAPPSLSFIKEFTRPIRNLELKLV